MVESPAWYYIVTLSTDEQFTIMHKTDQQWIEMCISLIQYVFSSGIRSYQISPEQQDGKYSSIVDTTNGKAEENPSLVVLAFLNS